MSDAGSVFQPQLVRGELRTARVDGGELAFAECLGPDQTDLAPMILIHGWSSNRHSLGVQFEHWSTTRRTVALDLRGHGDSAAVDGPYTVERFAHDLAALCDQLELSETVLVGHSMGGAVALESVKRSPGIASAVVLLDGYGCYPDPQRNFLGQMLLEQIDTLGFAPVMEMVVDQAFFLPGADPALIAWIKAELTKTNPEMAVEAYRNLLDWNGAEAAAACEVPIFNLVSTVPFNEPERFAEVCPQAVSEQTVGAGHFHGIEVPDQVHSRVDQFLAGLGR